MVEIRNSCRFIKQDNPTYNGPASNKASCDKQHVAIVAIELPIFQLTYQ